MTSETKTILITGATSGIGRAAALQLVSRGHTVIATGRNEAALDSLAAAATDEPGTLLTHRLDVTDAQSISEARAFVQERTDGRGVDVLINNAGFGVVAPAIEIDPADLRSQFETNVFGLVAVTQAFADTMRARQSGTIINVSSVGGRITLPLIATYNGTKYAVESISDGLRTELRPFGIHVALVEPGLVDTNFNDAAVRSIARYTKRSNGYAGVLRRMAATMARTGPFAASPERVARTLVRAAEARRPWARYVTPLHNLLGIWAAKLLPTFVVDAVLRLATGLRRESATALPSQTPADAPLAGSSLT